MITPGTRLYSWVIEERLGSGGMGSVYLARDAMIPDEVAALKVLAPMATEDERARFLREVQALRKLTHPAIVGIKNWGQTDEGKLWLAMELVQGPELSELIGRGAMPVEQAVTLFSDLADGLAHAHDQQIFHRDLKPANVIVRDGRGVLVDFGVSLDEDRTRLTQTGMMPGTPAYMSPEVFRGEDPDPALCDLYALGQMLHETLTGGKAFSPPDTVSSRQLLPWMMGRKLQSGPLDPGAAVPEPLRQLVQGLTTPEPADRIPTAREVYARLTGLGQRRAAVGTEWVAMSSSVASASASSPPATSASPAPATSASPAPPTSASPAPPAPSSRASPASEQTPPPRPRSRAGLFAGLGAGAVAVVGGLGCLGVASIVGVVVMLSTLGVPLDSPPSPPIVKAPTADPLAGEGSKAKKEEGKVGKKDAKVERAKGNKVQLDKAAVDQQIAEDVGILAALRGDDTDVPFGSALNDDTVGGIGGLIGSKGTQIGSGGLGTRGSGIGGGGTTADVGGLGTTGTSSGESGSGSGSGNYGAKGTGAIGAVGGDPIILGALDRSLIDGVIKRHMNQIRYCYQRELTKNPAVQGKLVVKFVVAKDGTVSQANIKSSTMSNSNVESCVVSRFRRMKFPEPKGGGIVIISYPFIFKSG